MKKLVLLIPLLLFASCENYASYFPSDIFNSSNITSDIYNSISTNDKDDIIIENNSTYQSSINTTKKIKIYLNPSVQTANIYYNNTTNEATMMNKVSNEIYNELSKDTRFEVYHNNRNLSLKDSVNESNSLNVDYHLALHTNAGGGTGSEAYYNSNSSFAKLVLSTFNKYHNYRNRGVKKGSTLYELKNTTAKNSALIEFLFHDNYSESKFIIDNYKILASSMVEAFKSLVNE